eukprot:TRINITY_DN55686_c0_g2_i1.p1 TRINITY_DN55686_c0_g2~~TRINITY_DN55686_c0_g2_i1.p1  ORF type:complete len:106 (+),score=2.44 TRINITY_DN55686_c0_g2_i1:154-471(+)
MWCHSSHLLFAVGKFESVRLLCLSSHQAMEVQLGGGGSTWSGVISLEDGGAVGGGGATWSGSFFLQIEEENWSRTPQFGQKCAPCIRTPQFEQKFDIRFRWDHKG